MTNKSPQELWEAYWLSRGLPMPQFQIRDRVILTGNQHSKPTDDILEVDGIREVSDGYEYFLKLDNKIRGLRFPERELMLADQTYQDHLNGQTREMLAVQTYQDHLNGQTREEL